jgi:hypothetical protein
MDISNCIHSLFTLKVESIIVITFIEVKTKYSVYFISKTENISVDLLDKGQLS